MRYYTLSKKSIITHDQSIEKYNKGLLMDISDFKENAPGNLIKIPEGVFAFVPEPLPPRGLDFDTEVISRLSNANFALGELKGIGATLQNPYLLIGPLSRREAIVSSRMEGTIASAEELFLFDAHAKNVPVRDEVREVANYVKAMDFGIARLKELPMCIRLIRETHEQLMTGVRGKEWRPGEFRRLQNFIGTRGQRVEDYRYVPPPVNEMMQAMDALETYLNGPRQISNLVDLALIHYQFEAIHPFMDGNGRIGRLLNTLLLCAWHILPQPFLHMSSYFERNKSEYLDTLLLVSKIGAWRDWVLFFLQGVIEQSEDAINRSGRLLDLQKQYRQRIRQPRASALLSKLVDQLFASPWTNMGHAAKFLNITNSAAQRHIDRLVEVGIIREITGRARGRVYISPEILEVIEKDRLDT